VRLLLYTCNMSTRCLGWKLIVGACALGVIACQPSSGDENDAGSAAGNDAGHDPGSDAGDDAASPDAGPVCAVPAGGLEALGTGVPNGRLDLLFVIDDSRSMLEEQQKLGQQLPRLVKILTTGDLNQDGDVLDELDFEPITSLHLGVVSSNMGTLGQLDDTVEACKGVGDDGVLLDTVSAAQAKQPSCAGVAIEDYMTFAPTDAEPGDPEQVASDFACVAMRGTEGCGLEQQLEAMLKAVTPEASDIEFTVGNGHGDGKNAGFVREDAVLAVVHVSDEEDCSVTEKGKQLFTQGDDAVYNGPSEDFAPGTPVGLNFKCANAADNPLEDPDDLLQPARRFIDGLKALKPANPDRIIFAAIVGVPEAAATMMIGDQQDFSAILQLEEMQVMPGENSLGETSLDALPRPACTAANGVDGSASPARRFVEVAAGFHANGLVRSICGASYESGLVDILQKVGAQASQRSCLPEPIESAAGGIVACDVVETLAAGQQDCDARRGRVLLGTRSVGGETRTVCKINQVAVRDGQLVAAPEVLPGVDPLVGWYYGALDRDMPSCPRIMFTAGAELAEDASLDLACGTEVSGATECAVELPR
jgi:hypothetical protein